MYSNYEREYMSLLALHHPVTSLEPSGVLDSVDSKVAATIFLYLSQGTYFRTIATVTDLTYPIIAIFLGRV
jgi:hypothetical protein